MADLRELEAAIWSIADGRATDADEALFDLDVKRTLNVIDRLIGDAEESLASVSRLPGDERDQIVADFTDTLHALVETSYRIRPRPPRPPGEEDDTPGPVQLQASWVNGQIVMWAAGRNTEGATNDELATLLELVKAPPKPWETHAPIELPGSHKADAVAIALKDALGWLLGLGAAELGGSATDGTRSAQRPDVGPAATSDDTSDGPVSATAPLGASVRWLGRIVCEGVRAAARGSIVPSLKLANRADTRHVDTSVRWTPALVDAKVVDALAAAMPGAVTIVDHGSRRPTTVAIITAVIDTIVRQAAERIERPAQPPSAGTQTDLADSVIARVEGTPFKAGAMISRDLSRRFDQWTRIVTDPTHPRLVVQLDAPTAQGVWLVTVHLRTSKGQLTPIDEALKAQDTSRAATAEWTRLNRMFPALGRAGIQQRGRLAMSQDEAWLFMTELGPTLASIGFEVRAPELSRRKPRPSLRLFAEAPEGSKVGAHQLANVAWTVLFDDVELTAAEIQRLARQARPLIQSHGHWIEVDRADLEQAAAALAEREDITQLTGAEILRHSFGLDASGLAGGVVVHGSSWAADIVRRAGEARDQGEVQPTGFVGELRAYQAEALAWIGFLDAAELGGCLALDMGLGKTPTVLAHLARTSGPNANAAGPATGTSLVVAPAAVVGNWAAEAAKFAPGLRVVVHHGAQRSSADELAAEIARADLFITTYATAVRDLDALERTTWGTVVLDEAQAIKNPASDTAQQLRRLQAHTRLALTGTPIENGVGDLWAILDFTNPGLMGPRAAFVAQMNGDRESALRALNGVLLFRRTKNEPEVAAQLPDKIDELDHCTMTPEQIGLYQAVLDQLVLNVSNEIGERKEGAILAAITALKQICNHPSAYLDDGGPLAGRSGKLARLEEIVESVFAAGERVLVFTHFATWGRRLADHLTKVTGEPIHCYDGSLARGARDKMVAEFQTGKGPGALVLSLKAGGTGLNLTAANHVVLYDRWWNPAVEDQARDRAWRIGQDKTVISHRLVCPGTVDEKVEEVVAGKRHIANVVLPKGSSMSDLTTDQLRLAFGLRPEEVLTGDDA